MSYWKIKQFKTAEQKDKFLQRNKNRFQMAEIFINNGFAVEYKDLIKL